MKDAMPELAFATRAVLEEDIVTMLAKNQAHSAALIPLAAAVVDAAIVWVRDCDAVSIGSDAEIFAHARRVIDAHENAADLLTTAVRVYERERN